MDALVVFSEAEAGPIVAWEAMIHGVVPIVSDFIGRAEENVIRDVVFPVGDVEGRERLSGAGKKIGGFQTRRRRRCDSAARTPRHGSSESPARARGRVRGRRVWC